MPTYEYECKKCGHAFEEFQRMSEKPICKCPKCSGPVVRLPGRGAGIIFKGSGFYATDYRSESYKQKEKAERGAAGGKTADKEKVREKGEGHKVGEKRSESKGNRAKRED
ncbi:MAG: zinc ribbon domain-containing protein [Candidatus Eisenbacteria bacterium]|nr:zinc ribbon domain-containing protein [Candidatus Eisenbacteria bacterium]